MTTIQKWIVGVFGIVLFMIPITVLIAVASQDHPYSPTPVVTVHQPGQSPQFTDPGWDPFMDHTKMPLIPPVGPATAPTPGTDGMGVVA